MKNLKHILPAIIATAIVFSSCNNKSATEATGTEAPSAAAAEATYTVVTDSSSAIKWKGVMLGIKEHFGTVSLKEGSVTTKDGKLVSGSFTADLSSIVPLDAAYDEKTGSTKEKLVGHLSSPDFFDVANHPTATFVINSVEGNTAKGTLTIRGKANEETLSNITISESEGVLKASGSLKFDRKKYDVAFDVPVKDMVISNDIELNVDITAKK